MSAPLISLSELGGLPGVTPPSDPQADLQNGVQNANSIASAGLSDAAGAVKNPGIPFTSVTTKIDPETGEQTHEIKGATDWFLKQAQEGIAFKNQAAQAYDAQIKQQEQQRQIAQMAQTPQGRLTLTEQLNQQIQQSIAQKNQVVSAIDSQIGEAQRKKDFLTSHPLVAQLGRLSSLAAAAYNDPRSKYNGLIRGAGVFGGDTFGESPEQIGGRISALQGQKLGAQESVTNVLEKGAALEEAQARSRASLEEKAATDREKIASEGIGTSARGESNAPAALATVQRLVARGGSTQEAMALYDQMIATQKAASDKMVAEEKFKAQLQGNGFAQANAMQTRLFAQQNYLEAQREAARIKLDDQKESDKAKTIALKAVDVDKATSDNFSKLATARDLLNEYYSKLQALKTGVVGGRVLSIEQKVGLSNELSANAQSLGTLLNPLLVGQEGGGARAVASPAFQALIAASKPGVKNGPEQNAGNYKAVSSFLDTIEANRVRTLKVSQIPAVAQTLKDPAAALSMANQNDPVTELALEKFNMGADYRQQRVAQAIQRRGQPGQTGAPQPASAPQPGKGFAYTTKDGKLGWDGSKWVPIQQQ